MKRSSQGVLARIRSLIWVTIFMTGFSGLVYEVTWQRYLSNLLGSQARAISIILAVYLGGLSAGYFLFGRLSRNRPAHLTIKLCGWAEVGIGLWAVLFPNLYSVFFESIGLVNPLHPLAILFDILTAVALIGPPTVLMGCTFPLLTQGLSSSSDDTSKTHSTVFALNTTGAFLGSLIAGFFLLPKLGLPIVDLYMAAVNLVSGLILIACANSFEKGKDPINQDGQNQNLKIQPEADSPQITLPAAIIFSFLAGFIGICFQVVLMRIVGITMGSSEYAFCTIVSVYILMLALGAARQRNACATPPGTLIINQGMIVIGLVGIYILVPYLPYLFMLIRTLFTNVPPNFYFYHLAGLLFLLLCLVVPVGAMGRTMPLVFSYLGSTRSRSGSKVGLLYFWNAFGCVFGGLVGGYFLLQWMNLDMVLKICIGLATVSGVTGIIGTNLIQTRRWASTGAALLIAISIFCLAAPKWPDEYLGLGLFRVFRPFASMYEGRQHAYSSQLGASKMLARRDDPNTSVAVVENKGRSANGTPYARFITVNGKSDSTTSIVDGATVRLLAHLPLLFAKPKGGKVALVGFGTGVTAGTLSLYPDVTSIETIEISTAVRDLSSFFAFANSDVTHDPRFKWRMADAYRFLSSSLEKYSVIISEPSNPWVGGVERLYTTEFYRRAKLSLETGGFFSQWFHTYSISSSTLRLVLSTISSVFEHVYLFLIPEGNDMVILARDTPLGEQELSTLEQRIKIPAIAQDLALVGIRSPEQLLDRQALVPAESYAGFDQHTLDFPKLSYWAGEDFFMGAEANVSDLVMTPQLSIEELLLQKDRLLTRWSRTRGVPNEKTMRALAEGACMSTDLEAIDPNRAPRKCAQRITTLGAFGALAGSALPSAVAPQAIRDLSGLRISSERVSKPSSPADPISKASRVISVFERHDPSLISLQTERLLKLAAPCINGIDLRAARCRMGLIHALAVQGFSTDARRELQNLRKSEFSGELSSDITSLEKEINVADRFRSGAANLKSP